MAFADSGWGSWSTGADWRDVQAADVNGDGKDDLVAWNGASGAWWMLESTGAAFVNESLGSWDHTLSWLDVSAADVTGDGRSDIAAWNSANGEWCVLKSTETSGDDQFVEQLWGAWSKYRTWLDVQPADVNADGLQDMVGRVSDTGRWWAMVSDGTDFTNTALSIWDDAVAWADVQTGDFNRDGRDDLVGRNPATGEWLIARSTGTSAVNESWGAWTMPGTYVDVLVGVFAEPDNAEFQPAPVYRNEFDKAGNLRFEIDALGRVTEHRYDARKPTCKNSPQRSGWPFRPAARAGHALRSYDPLHRLTEERWLDGAGATIRTYCSLEIGAKTGDQKNAGCV